ncbi:P-loop containing nucleoside triphosphate hydrolase protein [Gongronella butleri]|nr:P-loop containing nucleoside triphosphate hydrolase protein [Gongronella butleri]
MSQRLCFCNKPAARRQVKKSGPNFHQWFFTCSSSDCSFFKWETKRLVSPDIAAQQERVKRHRVDIEGSGVIQAMRDRTTNVTFCLHSATEIGIELGPNSHALVPVLQKWTHVQFDHRSQQWLIPATMAHYKHAYETILKYSSQNLTVQCHPLSNIVIQLLKDDPNPCHAPPPEPSPPAAAENDEFDNEWLDDPDFAAQCTAAMLVEERIHTHLKPLPIWNQLLPYQRQGVHDALSKNARVLLADDMGLGKTIQALAIATALPENWPVLIICPSSVLLNWSDQIQQWLPCANYDIHITIKGSALFGYTPMPLMSMTTTCQIDPFDMTHQQVSRPRFYIISYEMATKHVGAVAKVGCNTIICDESHHLKNYKTKRTKTLTPLLQKSRALILLSGTPALSRPIELYPQLHALNKELFPSLHEFGVTYCAAHQSSFGWNYMGASNLTELHFILYKSVMIRRTKDQVQLQLPTKTRHKIQLDIPHAQLHTTIKLQQELREIIAKPRTPDTELMRKAKTMELYVATSKVKQPAVLRYLENALQLTNDKVVVFAYHMDMMDALAQCFRKRKITFVRMDGSTRQVDRHRLCQAFQTRDDVQVALLSITAMNVGLDFHAASAVIFAELYWNPSQLMQAEDRVHRIGQDNHVHIKYLLALDTADEMVWSMLMKKMEVVGHVMDRRTHHGSPTQMDASFTQPIPTTQSMSSL